MIAEFAAIRAQIERIERAKANPTPGLPDWRPQPGVLCRWCKYAQVCSYYTDATDEGMPWLDDPDGGSGPDTNGGDHQRRQLRLI